jgi:hypothetical protein
MDFVIIPFLIFILVPLKVLTDSELVQVVTFATAKDEDRAVSNGGCPFPTTPRSRTNGIKV